VARDRADRTHVERLTPGEEALWQSMIRIVKLLPRQLDSDLRRGANVTITEYDALRRLSQAPDRQLRMSKLAVAVGLSASRTTRLVETLQARGFVTKITSSTDARGGLARLTFSGSAKVASAWPTYVESLRARLFDHMEVSTIDQVARALAGVAGRFDGYE
jgi:DNA-binding MarR family transcriptional regulator